MLKRTIWKMQDICEDTVRVVGYELQYVKFCGELTCIVGGAIFKGVCESIEANQKVIDRNNELLTSY